MRMLMFSLIAALCLGTTASEAAGVKLIEIPGRDGSAVLKGAVWTPCASPLGIMRLGRIEVPGVKDCPIAGTGLPLIVISHGGRGWFGGHHDTAAALADAGYVVAAITHNNEYGRSWRTDRPAEIKHLIDYMLDNWPDRERIDRNRIGFFGFSRGAYTGLVLIGGTPDFRRFATHCRTVPEDPVCRPLPSTNVPAGGSVADPPTAPFTRDPRIKAAVIAAPLGIVFSPEGLGDVSVPVQLWRPEHDELLIHPYNAEAVYEGLNKAPDYRVVPNAGHFVILAPCTAVQARVAPKLCIDRAGFDRRAFHKMLNAEIVSFFRQHLAGQ